MVSKCEQYQRETIMIIVLFVYFGSLIASIQMNEVLAEPQLIDYTFIVSLIYQA